METAQDHKPTFLVPVTEPIEFAFECDGVAHYQFVDPFKTPAMRGVQALVVYEEFRTRTSREMYALETEAETACVNGIEQCLQGHTGTIKLVDAAAHLTDLKKILRNRDERMKMVFDPDMVYKLASVVFFDQSENPHRYDQKYAQKVKIPRWRKSLGDKDFFLLKPLGRLIPYLKDYADNSQSYSQTARTLMTYQLELLSTILSKRQSIPENDPISS